MAAITGTLAAKTEFAGNHKLITVTATIANASDTITLTEADHGIKSIAGVTGHVITGGLDEAFSFIQVNYSGSVLTIKSFEQDGTAATDFTGTTVEIGVIGTV